MDPIPYLPAKSGGVIRLRRTGDAEIFYNITPPQKKSLVTSWSRTSTSGKWIQSQRTSTRVKKERRERTGSWRLHNWLLAYQAILASSSSSIIILDFYYKNYSLSKWKTIDYLPKKIESPTYEKGSQIELNQVTLQRHNDSRVGISPPSEPDVKVSPHPALCRGISTHCFP